MRIPGFEHRKREPFLVRLEQLLDDKAYQADEIRHWFGNPDIESKISKQPNGRNNYLFSMACSMRRAGAPEPEIR